MYRIITENGRTVKRFETERQAEIYWDSMNGIITDDDGNEEHIYIEDLNEHADYRSTEEIWYIRSKAAIKILLYCQ